jgi:hypothetical protein
MDMNAFVAAGSAFLIAVLWFDLMFDVQTRNHREEILPPDVLDSISAYYRRVTTDAAPMNRLIGIVMLLTVVAIAGEFPEHRVPAWSIFASLTLAVGAIALAARRTVRNAVEFGRRSSSPERQSHLARSIYRDHLVCIGAMSIVLVLQLAAAI